MSIVSDRFVETEPNARLRLVPETHSSPVAITIPTRAWERIYTRILLLGDLVVLLTAVAAAQLSRFGLTEQTVATASGPLSYFELGGVLAVFWWISLHVHRTRSPRSIGHGPEEYRRVALATFRVFGVLAILALVFKIDASRGYIAIAFPVGLLGLLAGRKVARVQLHRRRIQGHALANVLVIGGPRGASQINEFFQRHPSAGYRVSGVWVPDVIAPGDVLPEGSGGAVPVLTASATLPEVLAMTQAEAVLVTDTDHLGSTGLRELTWQLEGTGIELMLSPNVLDIVGSRLHLHDVSGMPMLHVDEPQYAGATRYAKSLFDRVGAALLLAVLSPLLVVTALAIKWTSRGPVFYRQERVGRDGQTFPMVKFRSMRVDADAQLAALLAAEGKSLTELPKLTQDPRVTRVGSFIRRFSIDEVPQLFNVLKGDMSLVGPRPQRDFEVEQYDHVANRRLTVRPGMTGLWQVSGRSDLSYEEAIRLDVHYVENWSMTADLLIMWKTVRAVLARQGAY